MPELPDVEAARRYLLAQGIVGRKITGVRLGWPRAVQEPSPSDFARAISGQTIRSLERRAKFLLAPLDGLTLIFHLRMTGSLEVVSASEPEHPHTRNVFALDDGRELRFLDPRKLGMLWLVRDVQHVVGHLGPEPLSQEFAPQVLQRQLAGHRNVSIKALLCQQEVVAGIGNIYADEVLFCAGLHPERPAGALSKQDLVRLHGCIREVLRQATEGLTRLMPLGGPASETDVGTQVLRLPREAGAPCPRCGTPLVRIAVRHRGTYFCPRCQA